MSADPLRSADVAGFCVYRIRAANRRRNQCSAPPKRAAPSPPSRVLKRVRMDSLLPRTLPVCCAIERMRVPYISRPYDVASKDSGTSLWALTRLSPLVNASGYEKPKEARLTVGYALVPTGPPLEPAKRIPGGTRRRF